jgi:phenylacetate-coenzyme A ligase PaaK-like adenylate-forming protein
MRMEIPKRTQLEEKVFAINNEKEFSIIARDVYEFQFENNPLYQRYCKAVGRIPENVKELAQIPFLPISFFKTHEVKTTSFDAQVVFKSSGTTGSVTSSHHVKEANLYETSFSKGFKFFYGDVKDYCIIGLLPSYLERGNSSLVYMVDHLIKESGHEQSGFYLNEFEKLDHTLKELEKAGQKAILIGVTYALLDFSAAYSQQLSNTIIMETGGMKGRGREMTKAELYQHLKKAFGVSRIHSEYGMTELLSQAYGVDGKMVCPRWMRVLVRDETDPLLVYGSQQSNSGAINIIDLTNLYSCSFIATEDVGRTYEGGEFEILGRMDNSDIRGCSLMAVLAT